MRKLLIIGLLFSYSKALPAQQPVPVKPRVLVSTDIGGTDPDDNQSMAHLLMYSDRFDIEGLVSSPSYGDGSKAEILRLIDLYAKDLPKFKKHRQGFASPDDLRAVCKQGRHGAAPYAGYATATEGSNWIIQCARKQRKQPLWVLVWGGLEDLAQALHDAPEIQKTIKVYWIGGPNKKWSVNSYAYIAKNFPNLWFIEANASYNGFFSDNGVPDSLHNKNYYDRYIRDTSYLGKDFRDNRYKGIIKMGDTPSLLYLMDGDPNNPSRDNWGGSFERFNYSPRIVYNRNTTLADTVPVYSIVELHFKGPTLAIRPDSACFTMTVQAQIGEQTWAGFYLGDGIYAIKYAPKQTETLTYTITSGIPGFQKQRGQFVVDNHWPGEPRSTNYKLGPNWYTDRKDPLLFDGIWQGARTVLKWRNEALLDWAKRWAWLQ
ncbi:nucleoside hydrolase-like domain-containing protein [Spirosoma fluminis]